MKNTNNIFLGIVSVMVIVGGIVVVGSWRSQDTVPVQVSQVPSLLVPDESLYAFGPISMGAGKVSHAFTVRNTGDEAVRVTQLYTSCMCTTAQIRASGGDAGPFGMRGHGFLPRINIPIEPGEEAVVEAVFDPAAHGPAGLGSVNRGVYVATDSGKPLELTFSAEVIP
ncbi:MAG: DUF1573 domain-containing protein [Patescibacteria group bacterium]|nr:DUF1573 domain-containing protein [Patescibacteria group bacterium]